MNDFESILKYYKDELKWDPPLRSIDNYVSINMQYVGLQL